MERTRSDELQLVGRVVSHYRILEQLEEGGMGVVYVAEDMRLGRRAALKFLPRTLTRDEDARRRFVHEAQAASSLDDPHICTVYEIGESDDGDTFIAMAYYEGENLRHVVSNGTLPLGRAFRIALQIAKGLENAHRRGIVHRDIKPANVILTAGDVVKIVDFGVAKLSGRTHLTRTGARLGTAAYMAPEQVRGEDVDRRADVWAVGVVLAEMLTGRVIFSAAYEQAIFYQIVHQEPDLDGVPADAMPIVRKCLQKDPADRYGSMSELAEDLSTLSGHEASVPDVQRRLPIGVASGVSGLLGVAVLLLLVGLLPSGNRSTLLGWIGVDSLPDVRQLAVLPFRNVSGDVAGDAYCSGLMETLTSKLTHLEQFSGERFWVVPASDVISRSVKSAEDARRVFGANLVIDGSFHRQQDVVRLTLNLIDADTRRVLASEIIDPPSSDAIALQDAAIIRVAEMLRVEIPAVADRMLRAGGTFVPGAEEFYLQGRGYLNDYQTSDNVETAIGLFERALEEDSAYALVHAGLAEAYWRKYRAANDVQWLDAAVRHSEKALGLDSMLSAAQVMFGTVHTEKGEYNQALRAFQRALEIDPRSAEAYRGRSKAFEAQGMLSEAEETLKKSIALKPGYWAGYNTLGGYYFRHGEYEHAADQFQIVISLTPESALGYNNAGGAFLALGDVDRAVEMLERAVQIEPRYSSYANLAWQYFFQGNYAQAARSYERALGLDDSDHTLWAYLAESYFWSPGEREKAVPIYREALKRAERHLEVNPNDADLLSRIANYHAMLGNEELARQFLIQTTELAPTEAEIFLRMGDTFEHLGSRTLALEWIERAVVKGLPITQLENAPSLRRLRADSRYRGIVEKFIHP